LVEQVTSTTEGPTTTTTVPVQQIKISGSGTNANTCSTLAYLDADETKSPLTEPGTAAMSVTISTDAFPHPHKGDVITLSNTKLTLTIPADLIQLGVDFGLVTDGMQIPSHVTLVLAGSNTTEGTRTIEFDRTVTVNLVEGQAQAITTSGNLPNTTWTPDDPNTEVIFSEQSLFVSSAINILGGVTAEFDCDPTGGPLQFIGVGAQTAELPTTTTLPVTVTTAGATATTVAAAAAGGGSTTLPRTGGSILFWLAVSAMLIDLGIVALTAARRRGALQGR
jgi:hypothetical protein